MPQKNTTNHHPTHLNGVIVHQHNPQQSWFVDTLVAHIDVENVAVYALAQGRVTLPIVAIIFGELDL